jgi:two-component sensor histidine kinase
VAVELGRADDVVVITVKDDGVGISAPTPDGSGRMGLQIVRTLVEELGGRFRIVADGGTRAEVIVPLSRTSPGE